MQGDQHLNVANNLADQSYWDDAYATYKLVKIDGPDVIREWIEQHIPRGEGRRCLEVGCFPGRFLTVFGDLGYELNGLDLTPRVEHEFPEWLKSLGYNTGEFRRIDFFQYEPESEFDIVASFGFIEHFRNWEEVFLLHAEWVAKDGFLVIETPNFRGWFQRAIHLLLDYKNYKRHYVPSMNPKKWEALLAKSGFEIVHAGYIGQFEFWIDEQPTNWLRRKLLSQLLKNYNRLKAIKPGKKAYAPYCGIIARKK
jgi:2-polyprenyl-3-methyl-5-hydroxy-6-metoxy-1,4-benzoquinol methylase